MVAPTKSFSAILDAQLQSGKPIDQTLLTQIRDSLIFLEEWLGQAYTAAAAQNHNHDGVNSAAVINIPGNAATSTNAGYAAHAGYADGSITWAGIGSEALLYNNTAAAHGQGGIYAGSGLIYLAEIGSFSRAQLTTWPSATTLPGSWMCKGYAAARDTYTSMQNSFFRNYSAIYTRVA